MDDKEIPQDILHAVAKKYNCPIGLIPELAKHVITIRHYIDGRMDEREGKELDGAGAVILTPKEWKKANNINGSYYAQNDLMEQYANYVTEQLQKEITRLKQLIELTLNG